MNIYILILFNLVKIIPVLARNSKSAHRDGPIGLPGHVLLRNSRERTRRHRREIIDKHSPEIEKFNKEIKQETGKSKANLVEMKEIEDSNVQNNILDVNQMNYNYNFDFIPEWFSAMPDDIYTAKGFVVESLTSLAHMGLTSLISTDVFQNAYCSVFSSEMEKAICLKNCVENINKIAQAGRQIMSLNFRVLVGGHTAKEALVVLNSMASNPENVGLIKTLGSSIVMYITLMREIIGDEVKALAGSVMTKLTDLPVASNIPDVSSGGFGRVNVILPRPSRLHRADYDIAKLKAGASEKELLTST